MKKISKFSPEVRDRAVRMVFEHRGEHASQWVAVESIAAKIGCTPQTLLIRVRRHGRATGQRDGPMTAEQQHITALEREVHELRKANSFCGWPGHAPRGIRGRADLQAAAVAPSGYWRHAAQQRDPALHGGAVDAVPWDVRCDERQGGAHDGE